MLHCGGSDACALGASCLDVLNQQMSMKVALKKLVPRCAGRDRLQMHGFPQPDPRPTKTLQPVSSCVKFDRKHRNQQI